MKMWRRTRRCHVCSWHEAEFAFDVRESAFHRALSDKPDRPCELVSGELNLGKLSRSVLELNFRNHLLPNMATAYFPLT